MVFVIQCDPEVPPGLASAELDRLSAGWRLVRLDWGEPLPEVQETEAVILLGGSMSANDEEAFPFLRGLKIFVRNIVSRGISCLGICLGGQLLAAAFGAEVTEKRWGERGNCEVLLTPAGREDALFLGIKASLAAFQWHDDSFDLPEAATLLASSERCPHQAFRIGTNAWGLQFHPEVTPEIIGVWASWEPSDQHEASELILEWTRREKEYRHVMTMIMSNFLGGRNPQ